MGNTGERSRVLVVDDDAQVLAAVCRMLGQSFALSTATCVEEGLAVLATGRVEVVLTDHDMPGGCGCLLLEAVRKDHPTVVRILMTGHAPEALASHLAPGLAQHVLSKPLATCEVLACLRGHRDG